MATMMKKPLLISALVPTSIEFYIPRTQTLGTALRLGPQEVSLGIELERLEEGRKGQRDRTGWQVDSERLKHGRKLVGTSLFLQTLGLLDTRTFFLEDEWWFVR
jgi:hypothetical protein